MNRNVAKITVGILGLIGTLLCGICVVCMTLNLGEFKNLIGAIFIIFLCSCSAAACFHLISQGRNNG